MLDAVEIAVASDWPVDIWVVCEVAPTRTVESVDDREVSALTTLETDVVIVRLAGSAAFRTLVVG